MYDAAPRHRIADDLEPGPLRAELGGAPLPAESAPEPDGTFVARMTFTGRGDEYFRIWVVNLFLSIVTLGVYSAWAKVRKTKYFWQNARLDGHVFDFHGNPLSILRGRIVALALLAAYSWGYKFSPAAGFASVAVLLAAGPWLFVKAQQFKFANTSFRGLRFGFAAAPATGYRVVLPIPVLWFSTIVLAEVVTRMSLDREVAHGGALIASILLIPGVHHRLKAFQHGHATYGERHFTFRPALVEFYWVYVKGLALLVVGGLLGPFLGLALLVVGGLLDSLLAAFVAPAITGKAEPGGPDGLWFVYGAATALTIYVIAWPYLAVRLQQVVWAHTRADDVRFRTEIAAWPLFKLVLRNVALTLATCGLYWPYAAVALARYRVECMRVDADMPLATIAAGTFARGNVAVGDAAADTFGFDLGL